MLKAIEIFEEFTEICVNGKDLKTEVLAVDGYKSYKLKPTHIESFIQLVGKVPMYLVLNKAYDDFEPDAAYEIRSVCTGMGEHIEPGMTLVHVGNNDDHFDIKVDFDLIKAIYINKIQLDNTTVRYDEEGYFVKQNTPATDYIKKMEEALKKHYSLGEHSPTNPHVLFDKTEQVWILETGRKKMPPLMRDVPGIFVEYLPAQINAAGLVCNCAVLVTTDDGRIHMVAMNSIDLELVEKGQ